LLIGYPMAYAIARAPVSKRSFLLMLVILPFWTSFLLRVYAWMGLLNTHGLINKALMGLGVIDAPLTMMYTDFALYIGIVYSYLPFMILPLYANLEKLDASLLDAAADLGASPLRTFVDVTLPLSLPGIIAGCMLVFIPAMGEFVIPSLLGGADSLMIGRVLYDEFFINNDWPLASAIALVLLTLLIIPIMILRRYQEKETAS
jgi:putrescine transport system permease protein